MTTTSVNPYPNIAPPAVAEPMCDWADWDNEVPVVTNDHRDDGTNIVRSPIAGPTRNMVAVECVGGCGRYAGDAGRCCRCSCG